MEERKGKGGGCEGGGRVRWEDSRFERWGTKVWRKRGSQGSEQREKKKGKKSFLYKALTVGVDLSQFDQKKHPVYYEGHHSGEKNIFKELHLSMQNYFDITLLVWELSQNVALMKSAIYMIHVCFLTSVHPLCTQVFCK